MKEITIEKIINKLNYLNIIDIRENYLFNISKIPYAKNIPMNLLLFKPNLYLNNKETYYIYCNFGVNSKNVCEELTKKGYDVVNIIGGFNQYKIYLKSGNI